MCSTRPDLYPTNLPRPVGRSPGPYPRSAAASPSVGRQPGGSLWVTRPPLPTRPDASGGPYRQILASCYRQPDWVTVKVRWDLTADQAEVDALRRASTPVRIQPD